MYLSQYLWGLKSGDVIDPDIIETLTGTLFTQPDPRFPALTYSSVSFPKYQYSYVRWAYKGMCFGIMKPTYELLSTQFSGCHLARFTDSGTLYGCHIHCEKGVPGDQRATWNNYVRALENKVSRFFSRITDCEKPTNATEARRSTCGASSRPTAGVIPFW